MMRSTIVDHDPWDSHDSEDFLYVLDGAIAVHLADRDPVELRRGDSMQMDGRIPHALVALATRGGKPEQKTIPRLSWISAPFS